MFLRDSSCSWENSCCCCTWPSHDQYVMRELDSEDLRGLLILKHLVIWNNRVGLLSPGVFHVLMTVAFGFHRFRIYLILIIPTCDSANVSPINKHVKYLEIFFISIVHKMSQIIFQGPHKALGYGHVWNKYRRHCTYLIWHTVRAQCQLRGRSIAPVLN